MEWDAKHLRLATNAAGVAFWSWNVATNRLVLDDRGHDLWGIPLLWGVPLTVDVSFEELSTHVHPGDLDRVRDAFAATRDRPGLFEIDFRILVEGKIRWISARGQGDDADLVDRTMFGIFLDVTGRRQAEERHELLAGEMSHRVRNLLAVASSLTTMTSRSTETTSDMARELTRRLAALGRAHDLARPIAGPTGKAAHLDELLTDLLAPYGDMGAPSGRIRIAAPPVPLGEMARMTLALVVHELATNSLKHGALSTADGTVGVSCEPSGDQVTIVWTERGGPPVTAPQGAQGHGIDLVSRTVSYQLDGSLDYDWDRAGVIVTLRVNRDALAD